MKENDVLYCLFSLVGYCFAVVFWTCHISNRDDGVSLALI